MVGRELAPAAVREREDFRLPRNALKSVPKVWGEERWIVNNRRYCGKQMLLRKGWRCSMHMHEVKDETFFVTKGRMLFEIEGH